MKGTPQGEASVVDADVAAGKQRLARVPLAPLGLQLRGEANQLLVV
jgi:hypothetical protein